MSATSQAKALLEAASHRVHGLRACKECRAAVDALAAMKRLGFTPTTLAVAITLAEAAEHSRDEDCSCKARKTLAEWEGLWASSSGVVQ